MPSANPASFTTLNPATALSVTPPVPGTAVQTTQYWNGTALTTLSNNNAASVQRWLITSRGTLVLQVGEVEYTNLTAAQASIGIAPFTQIFPGNNLVVEIMRMASVKSTSNLADTTQAVFSQAGAGGGGGSGGGSAGTVTSVSVVAANGFTGTVANPSLTPAITLATNVTGVLKGNGTAISAAVSGTDFKTVGSTSILGSGDIPFPASTKDTTAVNGILKGNGAVVLTSIAGTDYIAPGGALGTPASGTLTNCTADGTNQVGYRNIPQNIQSTAYTCVLADAGKHLLHPSADTTARTFTIPTDASVAYPIGTAITFVNQNAGGVITISIASANVMRLAGAGTTGNRTLAANGVATAVKLTTGTSAEWIISGVGLT